MAKKHSKPTGTIGSVILPSDGRPPKFQAIPFSSEKAESEQMVVKAAVSPSNDLGRFYNIAKPPTQNKENGFDFLLETQSGIEYLELMETAPLQGAYSSAPLTYKQGELADAIVAGIAKKSKRYGGGRGKAIIHLLLYSTDFRFNIGNDVLWLVAKWASLTLHAFKSIVYVTFLDQLTIDGKLIFPQPGRDFGSIDEANVRGALVMIGDLPQVQTSADGKGAIIPIGKKRENPNDYSG